MKNDPLMQFFNRARNALLKEGELGTKNVTAIGMHGPVDIGAFVTTLYEHAPPNTVAVFVGDQLGGIGWEVEMPDGSQEKVYVTLPPSVGVESTVRFIDPPDQHDGVPITDTSVENLGSLYIATLSELVKEAEARFASTV